MDYLQGLTAISLGNPGRQVQSGAPIPARGLDVCKFWGHQAGDNGASLIPPGEGGGEPSSAPLPPAETSTGRSSSCTFKVCSPEGAPSSSWDPWEAQRSAQGAERGPSGVPPSW